VLAASIENGYDFYRKPIWAWPTFQNQAALQADPWGAYYEQIYGAVPTTGYPIDVGSNFMLYDDVLIKAKVKNIPQSVGRCPPANPPEGTRYSLNNPYTPPGVSWIWHPYPYQAVATNTWVEVMRASDPFGDEKFGAWFINAPGSGIYFYTGTTKSFSEHRDAEQFFDASGNENMCRAAAARDYDSVQFLAHVDHVNYPCDTGNTGKRGLDYMNIEIVGVKLTGSYACTTDMGAPASIKAGWKASKKCTCDPQKRYVNCQGVATQQAMGSDLNEALMHQNVSSAHIVVV
jgi:hypothetical protein